MPIPCRFPEKASDLSCLIRHTHSGNIGRDSTSREFLWKMKNVNVDWLMQGLPVVLGLIEPDFEEFGPLIHIGVQCIWRILELHGSVSMNQICRLLSGAGLAQRLVYALGSAIAFSRDIKVIKNPPFPLMLLLRTG